MRERGKKEKAGRAAERGGGGERRKARESIGQLIKIMRGESWHGELVGKDEKGGAKVGGGRVEGRKEGRTDGRMERASVRDIRHLDQTVTDNTEDTQLDGKLSPARLPDKQPDSSSEGGA